MGIFNITGEVSDIEISIRPFPCRPSIAGRSYPLGDGADQSLPEQSDVLDLSAYSCPDDGERPSFARTRNHELDRDKPLRFALHRSFSSFLWHQVQDVLLTRM